MPTTSNKAPVSNKREKGEGMVEQSNAGAAGSSHETSHNEKNHHHHRHHHGQDAKSRKREQTFFNLILCSAGIYFFYILYGIAQEKIAKGTFGEAKEKWKFPLFLVFVQCLGNCAFAFVVNSLTTPRDAKTSIRLGTNYKDYLICAMSYIGAMLCSNQALAYINYPTQVLAKSCKMIPVMFAGIIFLRKRYSVREYITVFCVTIGISVFMLKSISLESFSSYKFTAQGIYGLVLVFLSLVLDGVTGTYEERIVEKYQPSSMQIMFQVNFWAVLLLLVGLIGTGQLVGAVAFASRYHEVITPLFCAALASGFGQLFIFYSLRVFGALVCSTITTTRKFFTITFSVFLFGHTLSNLQWFGVCLVFGGLTWDIYAKYFTKKSNNKKHHH